MKCPYCGFEIEDGETLCPACGGKIYRVSRRSPSRSRGVHLADGGISSRPTMVVEDKGKTIKDKVKGVMSTVAPSTDRVSSAKGVHSRVRMNLEDGSAKGRARQMLRKLGVRGLAVFIGYWVLKIVFFLLLVTGTLPSLESLVPWLRPAEDTLQLVDDAERERYGSSDPVDAAEGEQAEGDAATADDEASEGESAPAGEGRAADAAAWSEDCVDSWGLSPTAYACLELRGWQLETLLTRLGYTWDDALGRYAGAGSNALMVLGANGALDKDAIHALGAGTEGSAAIHVITVGGYAGAQEVLDGAAKVAVVDRIDSEDGHALAAVVESGSGQRCLMTITPLSDGTAYELLLVNEKALASGLYQQVSEVEGATLDEVWLAIAGREVTSGQ